MTQALHRVAEQDTPEQVRVPDGWSGLLVWAVGRFGGIVVATIMCAYALQHVYADMQATNNRMLQLMETRAVSDVKLADALNQMNRLLEDVKRDAEAAHRAMGKP